ncbi:5' nucleotidase, NT5C type [Paenibacillus amylolyticus]|uniref:5' nucleotidase, NT5C type n=1 Tax=Paenibacillus amylolyticus TaxID=1451 RepID=UPI003EBCA23C
MRKPIIAVDMDDTICQLVKRAIYHNNRSFPTHPLQYEDMVDWDTTHLRHPDSTHEVFYGRPGLFEELELYDEYVVEEMQKLNEVYDLIIVTAAEPRTVNEKWNWLQIHMPFIKLDQFITCKRKNLLTYDLLIDDGPHNLIPAVESGKKVICIPHPWNKQQREQYNFPQMSSWKDAKIWIDKLIHKHFVEKS